MSLKIPSEQIEELRSFITKNNDRIRISITLISISHLMKRIRKRHCET